MMGSDAGLRGPTVVLWARGQWSCGLVVSSQ